MIDVPYLTSGFPGVGGRIKEHVDDFRVEEIPLYLPCGRGTHAYFRVHKVGVPTPVAVNRIARHMGVRPMEIGVAGLKDSQAITSQMMSLEYADARRLAAFRDAAVRITDVSWHGNKLRIGHLAGNKFVIRIRGVGRAELPTARKVLDVLIRRGVPNFFGEQRFGSRGDTGTLGAAMVRGDLEEFVRLFLGRSLPDDPPDCRAARDAFDAGYFDRALQRWPRHYADQRRALTAYKRKGRAIAAVSAIDKRLKRLFVSAFQSEVFNDVLSRRLTEAADGSTGTFDQVFAGDLAQKTDTGGVFPVQDESVEQPRAERFEISPTGPIVGYRCNLAQGRPGQIERQALAERNVDLEAFGRMGALSAKGSRRALRFQIDQPALSAGTDGRGEFLELSLIAPPGCYATVVLREIMKTQAQAEEAEEPPVAD
jgi:tRNA pseudouridine13 synthase